MKLARSRVTAQGQVSVPSEVRRRLGLAPGSVIEWSEDGGAIAVRRVGGKTFEDVHAAAFPDGPPKPRTLAELKDGIAEYIRRKHGRRR